MKAVMLFVIIQVCIMNAARTQQETNHWFFGYNAGLNFSSGMPVFTPGSLQGWEGCSSVSDKKGNLLFYTNGNTVWNRNHQVMPNGTGLLGDTLSTQSSLITGCPGNDSLYYIFTTAKEAEPGGLQYSLVNTRLNGGLGDVVATQKNIPLLVPACEKVTAVKHRNANDIWVIAHKYGTNEFCVYLIDCTGLRTMPLTTAAGNVVDKLSNSIGYLKASPDGNTLAMAAFTSVVEVFDFDALTGNITNPRIIAGNPDSDKITGPYGIEFSGNSKLLYVSESHNNDASGGWFIYQYVIDTPNIADSKVAIDSGYGNAAGALQLGPDDKIYIAYDQQPYVGAITAPDIAGVGCGHVKQYVPFPAGIRSGVGLPSCVAGYKRSLLGSDTAMCAGGRKLFRINLPGTDFLWQNGSTPDSFVATAPGVYWLQIRYNNCTYRDTINIHYKFNPLVNLGKDTAICENKFPLLLQPTISGATYLWQDGSTQPLYQVNKAGLYYVMVSSNGCSQSDTLLVSTQLVPKPNLGPDKTLCAGQQLVLNPATTGTGYVWQDGSTRENYTVTQTGVYSVSVSNECGMQSDEIVVKEGTCAVAIPNAFTPGKSPNNIFRVLNASALKSFSLRVLNRWGQLMYQTTDPLSGWDGSLNGTPQPVGTYVYIVSYTGPATTHVVRKGVLVLVR